MKVWVSEQHGISPRTGKRVKGTLSTSFSDQMFSFDHTVAWEESLQVVESQTTC